MSELLNIPTRTPVREFIAVLTAETYLAITFLLFNSKCSRAIIYQPDYCISFGFYIEIKVRHALIYQSNLVLTQG